MIISYQSGQLGTRNRTALHLGYLNRDGKRIPSMALSPRMGLLIFAILVAVVFFFLLDLVGVHLPYTSRYLAVIVAILLYALAAKIADKLNHDKL